MITLSRVVIGEEEKEAVIKVLDSGMLAMGEEVRLFEEEFAEYIGVKYAVGVNSGTSALFLALKCLVNKGSMVVTTPFTFVATANAIVMAGAIPLFVDINPNDFCMDVGSLKKLLSGISVSCILPVHIFGQPCNMPEIMEIARENGAKVIEDCSQAHGASIGSSKVGSIGDIGAFSLYATKNLGAIEAGVITTNDRDIADKCRKLRNFGWSGRYTHDVIGYNCKMTNVSAAIARCRLRKLDSNNKARLENAIYLDSILSPPVEAPLTRAEFNHVFHLYTIKVPHSSRDCLMGYLERYSIQSGIVYPMPIYKQPAYKNEFQFLYGNLFLDNAEEVCRKVLSLPVHEHLSTGEIRKVGDAVNSYFLKETHV